MSTRSNNFRIGLFVISALGILVIAIVAFSSGELFYNPVIVETYLDQPVQGLAVGSAVKFRGVQIGRVETITFTHNRYQQDLDADLRERWVLVELALFPNAFHERTDEVIRQYLAGEIRKGMRIRMVTGGLTGIAYLETDFFDPKLYPSMKVPWTPQRPYIPSVPSPNLGRIGDSVTRIVRRLEKVEFDKIANNLDKLTRTATRAIDDAQVGKLRKEGIELLSEMRETNRRLRDLLERKAWLAIRSDAAAAVRKTREVAERVEGKIDKLFAGWQDAADNSNESAKQIRKLLGRSEFQSSLKNIDAAAKELPLATAQLRKMLHRANQLLVTQQDDLQTIVENIRLISENIRELSATVKKYPSQLLFGEPPVRQEKLKK